MAASSPAMAQLRPSPPATSSPAKVRSSITLTTKQEPNNTGVVRQDKAITVKGRSNEQQIDFRELISHCISNKDLLEGQHLRAMMDRVGYEPNTFLDNQFINLYMKCGHIDMAREVFDRMGKRNVVSWNALLAGYCSNGCFRAAASLFCAMIDSDEIPNNVTYLSALRASVRLRNLGLGRQIHSQVMKAGCFSRTEVGNALINMYSELEQPEESESVFDYMEVRDAITWNSLIAAKTQSGCIDDGMGLFVAMQRQGEAPDEFTFLSLLRTNELEVLKEIHAQLTSRGLVNGVVIGSALLDAYARFADTKAAMTVFNFMAKRNTITWNSIIDACFEGNMVNEGLQLFLEMRKQGVAPDEYTVSIMLKAATTYLQIALGKQIHGLAVKMVLHVSTTTGNGLIALYARHCELHDSWRAFICIKEPDLISWNSILQSYIRNEVFEKALATFIEMKHAGVKQDEFSFVSAAAACASLGWQGTGKAVHGDLIKRRMSSNAFVGCGLIDMYANFITINDARKAFNDIGYKDIVTWNSVISAFAQWGNLNQVLDLLSLMRQEMNPDNFTFATTLAASANAAAMQLGMQIHAIILKSELVADAAVCNALISMYSKAGTVEEAEKIFYQLTCKNVISWTAMIGGFAQNGCFQQAFDMFDQMQDSEVTPNKETFVQLLTACSHANMSSKSAEYFEMMREKYGIKPTSDHYACMVDVLGRAGRLQEAEDLITGMPFKADALVWRTLLSACRMHGDVERGERSMHMILTLEPGDSAAYVLLSNLYATSGNHDSMSEVRRMMRINGVKKEPGRSWIEMQNRSHEFVAADRSHPQTCEIYSVLNGLTKQMKNVEYAPVFSESSIYVAALSAQLSNLRLLSICLKAVYSIRC